LNAIDAVYNVTAAQIVLRQVCLN